MALLGGCHEVRRWLTANVLMPVSEFITEAQEKCQEFGQWCYERVTKPVEKFISQVQEFCEDLPWPLSWACTAVTVVVKVIEWVVETIAKWVVTVVCQIVTVVVGILVKLAMRLAHWLVTFVVCLADRPLDAFKSIFDLWNILIDFVSDVIAFIGILLVDVMGILDDIDRLLDSLASSLGWLGVILGIFKGLVGVIQHIVEIIHDAVAAAGDIVVGILTLNSCRILRGGANLGTAIGRGLMESGFAPIGFAVGGPVGGAILAGIRIIGAAVGGVRDSVVLKRVEGIIEEKINAAFGAGSDRATRSLKKVNFGSRIAGLPIRVEARRMFLTSTAQTPDLRALHNSGVINLRTLAGYGVKCEDLLNGPDAEVVYAGTSIRVSNSDIDTFLDEGPEAVPEFHVFPITRAAFRDHLDVCRTKAYYLGVQLDYTVGTLQITSPDWIPLAAGDGRDAAGKDKDALQQEIFRTTFGRQGLVTDDLGTIPALTHFHYKPEEGQKDSLNGLTSWFRPLKGDENSKPSGVTYRNRSPKWVFRWVLIHELGHYFGLNHDPPPRSLDEIMFAPKNGSGNLATAAVEFLLLGGEPRFTLDDARTVWDWITRTASPSLLP